MSPPVSVIVPLYNAASSLARCLDSLEAQTLPGLEVLLLDDASSDDSLAIAMSYAQRRPEMFRVLHQPRNRGIGVTRNTGLALARGDYVGFVDADDSVTPHMFQRMHEAACQRQAQVVLCGARTIFSNGGEEKLLLPQGVRSAKDVLKNSPLLSPPWNKLYQRDFLLEHGIDFPEASMSEDMAFAFKVMANGPTLACVQQPFYIYHKHDSNITLDIARRKEAFRSVADIRQYLMARGLFHSCKSAYRYINFTHLVYYPLCLLCIDALIKGRGRWHALRNAPAYFYELFLFWLRE